MNWNKVNDLNQLLEASKLKPVLLFKHSKTCSISQSALNRVERDWDEKNNDLINCFLVNVIEERKISNEIAAHFNIKHESPQVIVIKNVDAIYNASHYDIRYSEVLNELL